MQCAKKYWIWKILEENQKSYTWGECNTLSLPNYKADCGALHCKFSLSCLDNVYQDLWLLIESLRRKLSKNARDKLWLRVFLTKKTAISFDLHALKLKLVFVDLVPILERPVVKFSNVKHKILPYMRSWSRYLAGYFSCKTNQRYRYKEWHLLIHNSVLEWSADKCFSVQ